MKPNKRIVTVTIMFSMAGTTLALAAMESASSHVPGDPLVEKRASLESLIAEMDAAQAENERVRGELDRAVREAQADILRQIRDVLDGNAEYQTLKTEVARLVEQQRAANQAIQDAGTKDADRAEALKIRSYDLRKQREAAEERLQALERSIAVKANPELEPRYAELDKLQARSATLKAEWSQRRVERYRRWMKLRDLSPRAVALPQD